MSAPTKAQILDQIILRGYDPRYGGTFDLQFEDGKVTRRVKVIADLTIPVIPPMQGKDLLDLYVWMTAPLTAGVDPMMVKQEQVLA